MSVTYCPRIHWPTNELLLPPDLYGVDVPTALPEVHVRAPKYADVTVMGQLARSSAVGSPGGGLSIVNGLVTRELEVNFRNPATQWRCVSSTGGTGPGTFQFQGGEILLDLSLAIHILDHLDPDPSDEFSVQIFAEVYGHELLHVLDEIDILRNWLSPRLPGDPAIARLLSQPFSYGTRAQPIATVETEFRQYIRTRIHGAIRDGHWAPQTNERARRRDAPSEYAKVQDRIDTLRARQINR